MPSHGKAPGYKDERQAGEQSQSSSSVWLYGAVTLAGVLLAIATQQVGRNDKQEKFQRLVRWVQEAGGYVSPKISYVDATTKGAMLLASEPVKEGEKLMRIPRQAQISDASVRSDSALPRYVDGISDLSLGRSGVAAMAAWLTSRYGSYLQDPESVGPWRFWWEMFSAPWSMPFYRDATEQLLLLGSYEFQEIRRNLFWYTRDFEKLTEPCKKGTCSAEVRLMDFDAYQAMNQFILSHAFKGPGDKPHIIPIFEVLNHSPELASDLNYEMDGDGNLEVWAKWDIPPGTEITNSYGRRSNSELLASYGFADPPYLEPFWSLRIFTQALAEKHFPDMDIEDMEIDVRLATPWLRSLPTDGAAPTPLATLASELDRATGQVPSLLGLVETTADHFLKWYRNDQLIAKYRSTLEENRRHNASSSVWWLEGPTAWSFSREEFAGLLQSKGRSEREKLRQEASSGDLSDPRSIGFWNSTVVRVKMSEYLCAVAHKEALQLLRGELQSSEVMAESVQTAEALRDFRRKRAELAAFETPALRLKEEEEKRDANEATQVFTSTMPRAVASVCCMGQPPDKRSALNPIDKGVLGEGWWDVECPEDVPPWREVEKRHPEFMQQWKQDPLCCHFPGGESYLDVVMRLESVLIDVEMCTSPVLIVSHITTLQVLLAYFKGVPVAEAWKLSLPKRVVVEVSPTAGGSYACEESSAWLRRVKSKLQDTQPWLFPQRRSPKRMRSGRDWQWSSRCSTEL
ncbi:unnamed protein product [Effrenium voratum]|uniref:SET domain-containing protein n=1 Tax=Effrenium voratum TaxID=2562239 RepID=A0AA36HU88_9DINO|nr:unnamed protein product [Effrenium voratum]